MNKMAYKMTKRDTPRYLWDEFYIERPLLLMVDVPVTLRKRIKSLESKTDYKIPKSK
jgi:hypothetical protein